MYSALSLPDDDIDTTMRLVARNVAMDVYPLPKILEFCGVKVADFHQWKTHPRFLAYLKAETEAWNAAQNVNERTKLKAGIIMEEWMVEAYAELKNGKQPLHHRVELGKLITKLAGMGETNNGFSGGGGGGGGGFSLQINIAPGQTTTINARAIPEDAEFEPVEEAPKRRVVKRPPSISSPIEDAVTLDVTEDDYDPFHSPDTLGDL